MVFAGGIDRSNLFWACVKRLKLDAYGLVPHHIGRHTAATIVGDAGASTSDMQALFGWRSREMAERYTHPSTAGAERALEKLR